MPGQYPRIHAEAANNVTPRTVSHTPAPPSQRKITPEMPRIPGISAAVPRARLQLKPLLSVILAALLCASGFALWLSYRKHAGLKGAPGEPVSFDGSVPNAPTRPTEPEQNTIGTLYELATPWSSKGFRFVDPKTQQSVPAMIIHLPWPPAEPSFWAFALTNPLSRCQLQYVTDLSVVSRRFAYSAQHPMVVSDCDGVLYDPLKMATLPDGSWVRGDIVRGGGIRPPISIQVELHGRDVIAKRME
jgi:hypothetical protein